MSKSSTQDVEPEVEVNVSIFEKIRRFYRGTFFQAILLGLVSFTQPGIWVGLNSMQQFFSSTPVLREVQSSSINSKLRQLEKDFQLDQILRI